jgi:hypothetical protein
VPGDEVEGVIRRLKGLPPGSVSYHDPEDVLSLPRLAGSAALPQVPGYEVLEEVGSGGLGVIYRARQLDLNRIVALKMLRGDARTSCTSC